MRLRSAAAEMESAASRPVRRVTSRRNCCGVPLLNGASVVWGTHTGIDFRLRPSSWKLGWPSTLADVCREGARIGVLGTYAPSVGSRRTRPLAGQAAAAPQSLPGETDPAMRGRIPVEGEFDALIKTGYARVGQGWCPPPPASAPFTRTTPESLESVPDSLLFPPNNAENLFVVITDL